MNSLEFTPGAILRETREHIQAELGNGMNTITLERLVIGLFFTGVKLSNGLGGICFTPIKTIPEAVCCPSSAKAMPNSGKIKGTPVLDLVEAMDKGNYLFKAIGIAVLNALSETCWQKSDSRKYEIQRSVDALDVLEISEEASVAVVGALAPFIKKLKKREKSFTILEMDPSTLKPDEMPFYIHGSQAAQIIPKADVLVITGTTLINDTLDELLSLAKPEAQIAVVGPTASLLPDAFFRRGVDILGGISVTNPDELLDLLAEAGSGYHFFGKSADRTVIKK
ncbi:Rossmann-like domain-containing protein [Desulfitobacterium sp. AusDCA]|uniref:Rossmann-like domain-containing protein n=1 Tax=Desulfitobacterium sp. AusDCA TaxID=3240383 RepID=UPI003DA7945B